MIRFDRVTFTYEDALMPALDDVSLSIADGELCVVAGATGSGKSTLLRAMVGLVPRATGGTLAGNVIIAGRSIRDHTPAGLADVVGFVGQDPEMGFVTGTVEEELAYGMEQLGVQPALMRARVEETLDLLGIAELRGAELGELSGGEQQRVAIGSVLTVNPRVLILDEPTSALDPGAAEDVLATLTRLVHDLGITVVVAEHRLERVVGYADQIVMFDRPGGVSAGRPADVLAGSPVAPPIIELGRLAGWAPLPLSVRDARRHSAEVRRRIGPSPAPESMPSGDVVGSGRNLSVSYGSIVAVRGINFDVRQGEILVVMGRNGSGKSSLFWAFEGSGPHTGTVTTQGLVGLVPQNPADLLYLESVEAECAQADSDSQAARGTCRHILDGILPEVAGDTHPADLSEGQRLALVLAVQLTAQPLIVLLDEPTRGLDYDTKARLIARLRDLADRGRAVVVSTHDVEFAAGAADRVVVLADGDVITDGPAHEILTATPLFQSQVAKIMQPDRWLTVTQVADALATAP